MPTAAEGLGALVKAPAGAETWTGPYVEDDAALKDPWGQTLVYSLGGTPQGFFVKSLGADGADGGEGADRDIQAPAARR